MLMRTFCYGTQSLSDELDEKGGHEINGQEAIFLQAGTAITIISHDQMRIDCFGPVMSRAGLDTANHYCRHLNTNGEIIDHGTYPLEARGLEDLYLLFISKLPRSLREIVTHLLGLD